MMMKMMTVVMLRMMIMMSRPNKKLKSDLQGPFLKIRPYLRVYDFR